MPLNFSEDTGQAFTDIVVEKCKRRQNFAIAIETHI